MTTEDEIRLAVGAWLRRAVEDAERRGMPELKPLLEGLAESTVSLRKADWNEQVASRAARGRGTAAGGGSMKPLPDHSITELAPRIAARQVSAAELTDACLDRIARENGRLNAFITVLADRARARRAGPMRKSPPGAIADRCTGSRCR